MMAEMEECSNLMVVMSVDDAFPPYTALHHDGVAAVAFARWWNPTAVH